MEAILKKTYELGSCRCGEGAGGYGRNFIAAKLAIEANEATRPSSPR